MRPSSRRALLTLPPLLAAAAALPATAQDWPAAKPVRLVVPFPPGSISDAVARMVADRLTAPLGGQRLVIDNRGGAAGNIGTEHVARSEPAFDYPQFGRSAISIPSSMSARRESPRQRTMTPGGGSRERPRWPPRRASLRT